MKQAHVTGEGADAKYVLTLEGTPYQMALLRLILGEEWRKAAELKLSDRPFALAVVDLIDQVEVIMDTNAALAVLMTRAREERP